MRTDCYEAFIRENIDIIEQEDLDFLGGQLIRFYVDEFHNDKPTPSKDGRRPGRRKEYF